ncbi:hypothetical protein EV360DRAFT_87854 [Lentinula raphanica]|nr:hypothetical protein EV360DRAFT_87854 [Lentinula raphanica]
MLHYYKVLTVVFASGVASVLSVPVSLPVSGHGAVSTSDARANAVTESGIASSLSIPSQLGHSTEISRQPTLVVRAQKDWKTIQQELTARYGHRMVDTSQSIETIANSLASYEIQQKVDEFIVRPQPHQPYQEQEVKRLLGWLQFGPEDDDLKNLFIHVVDGYINPKGHGTNEIDHLTNNMGALNFEGDPSGSGSGSGSRPAGRR